MVAALALALTLLLAACSSGPPRGTEEAGDRAGKRPRGNNNGAVARADDAGKAAAGKGDPGALLDPDDGAGQDGARAPGTTEGEENDDGTSVSGNAALATASARVAEPQPDAQKSGLPPDYAEATEATIAGLGDQLRMTLTLNGEVPQQMPDDKTFMVINFNLQRNDDDGYAFGGQASNEGWRAYAGGNNKTQTKSGSKFPGTFIIDGSQIVMTVPWSYLDGPQPFKWTATSSWVQSVAQTTHYSFDLLPNKNSARYPN